MLQQQFTQLVATYQSITGARDLGGVVSALNAVGIQNPYLNEAAQFQSAVSGSLLTGGDIGTLAQQFLSTNRVYTPLGNDWQAQRMIAVHGFGSIKLKSIFGCAKTTALTVESPFW